MYIYVCQGTLDSASFAVAPHEHAAISYGRVPLDQLQSWWRSSAGGNVACSEILSARGFHGLLFYVLSLRPCSLGSDAATWYALMPLAWYALMPLAFALGSSRRRRCLLALTCLGRHGLLQRQPGKLGNVGVRARALASRVAL